jgi:cytoskeletal protein RodZ
MEGLGEKFQKARSARNLTLDEAARMTKIRPSKLAEIEAEDFSHFPSLAYAKGFVLIYGKFLNVDVTPYLEAFETSEHVTVDGYSYLQDNPAPPPRRTEVVRREPRGGGGKSSLMPLVIGIVVLVAGFTLLRLLMDIRRIKPARERDAQALAQVSPKPAAPIANTNTVVAPHALSPDAPVADPNVIATAPTITPSTQPAATSPMIASAPSIAPTPEPMPSVIADQGEGEPEVRRAEPVHPEDLQKAQSALAAIPGSGVNRFDIRPLKKTFVRVAVDNQPPVERALDVGAAVQLNGRRLSLKVMDPTSVEIRKNGKVVSRDPDITVQ